MSTVTPDDINAWVKSCLRFHGIQVITFNDGSNGLLRVPVRLAAVINDLHNGMVLLAAGESLPAIFVSFSKRKAIR